MATDDACIVLDFVVMEYGRFVGANISRADLSSFQDPLIRRAFGPGRVRSPAWRLHQR